MAVNYASLFADLGEIVQGVNNMVNDTTDWLDQLDTGFTAIADEYTTNGVAELLDTLNTTINSVKDSVVTMAGTLSGLADIRLLHSSVVDELPELGTKSTAVDVLAELGRDMVGETEKIEQSVLSMSAISRTVSNVNSGTAITQTLLTGSKAPSSSWPKVWSYSKYPSSPAISQLVYTGDTFTLECITDTFNNSIAEGNESFKLTGLNPKTTPWAYGTKGIGSGPTIKPANGPSANLVSNSDFESWARLSVENSASPEDYTLIPSLTGSLAGTTIVQGSEAADVYHGDSSLILKGASGEVGIQQELNQSKIKPHTAYALFAYMKKASTTSAGTVEIMPKDSSGSPQFSIGAALVGGISVGYGDLTTSYALYSAPVISFEDYANPLYLDITWSSTSLTDIVYIDYLGFAEMVYHGGVGWSIAAGSDKFIINDRLQSTASYSSYGVFQEFFREKYHIQLPSSGSPTREDTLATD